MLKQLKSPLRLSFIGGGINSSIGKMHFLSSQLDDNFKVVSGFFSRNNRINIETQKFFNLSAERIYNNLTDLVKNEKNKVDFFVVLTPTPNHYEVLKKLIKENVNIICEKPILSNLKEVNKIENTLKNYNKKIYMTYNYSGYPAIREIKEIINSNKFGKLLSFNFGMTQESFLRKQDKDQKVKKWRKVDKDIPNLFLDLGIHLYNLSFFLLNDNPESVFANSLKFKNIISDSKMFLNYKSGIKGHFWISKSSLGKKNDLRIELYFEKKSILWSHDNLEYIYINDNEGKQTRIDRSVKSSIFNDSRYNRYRMGHPVGFLEAFSNIYEDIASDYITGKNKYVFNHMHGFKGIRFLNFWKTSSSQIKLIKTKI